MAHRFGQNDSDEAFSLKRSLGELLGIARGLLADDQLTDEEIHYLRNWLEKRHDIRNAFPGSVIYERIEHVLADGVVTREERSHLVDALTMLIEDQLEGLRDRLQLEELWFDEVDRIQFDRSSFCLTGKFVYGPRKRCEEAIEKRGGTVLGEVGDETSFLVVGGFGVDEWRSGGLGAKIEAAMRLRGAGKELRIIAEDSWVDHL